MALVKYGGGIIEMSGSIAGNTFARNHYGSYVRARTKPVNPRSTDQNLIRSALTALTYKWAQILTDAQRTAWNLYGASVAMKNKLGTDVFMTGFNHYIRSNTTRMARYNKSFDDGPTVFELPEKDPSIAVTAYVDTGNCTLTFDDTMEWVDEDDAALIIWDGRPQNAQRNFFNGPWKGISDKGGDSGAPKTSPEYFDNHWKPGAGNRQWFKFRIRRGDGRLSEPFFCNSIVVATTP